MKAADLTIKLKAIDATKKAFSSAEKGIKNLKKVAGALAKGFAVATAAVAGIGAILAKTFNSNAPYIDALAKTSDKLGVTTEKLQAYRDAAEFAGIGQASLDTSLQRFIRRLGTAATGTGATAKEFRALGLSAEQLKAAGPDQAFEAVLDKIKQIPDATERVRLAFAFFGKEGVDLVRLTTDAIRKSEEQMERLNLSISRVDAAKVEMANDAIKRLGDLADGVGRRITVGMSGAIVVLSDRIIAAAADFGLFQNRSVSSSEIILTAVGKIVDIFGFVKTGIDLTRIAINKVSIAFLNMASTVATAFDDKILSAMENIPGSIGDMAREFQAAGGSAGRLTEKIAGLESANISLFAAINDRGVGSAADDLLAELAAVNAAAAAVSSAQGSVNTAPGAQLGAQSGGGTQDILKKAEAYKVSSENLKLFSVDTDAAAASQAAFHSVLSSAGSALGTLGDAFAKTKTQARAFVAIQQTLALVSAYSAATQALASPGVTPFEKFAAYASVLAQGLAGVAAIKKAGSSLGAGGASPSDSSATPSAAGASTIAAQPQNQRVQRPINVTIQGSGTFTGDQVEELIDAINDTDGIAIRADRVAA